MGRKDKRSMTFAWFASDLSVQLDGSSTRQGEMTERSASVAPKVVVPPRAVLNLDYATLWNPPERLKFEDIPWPPCDSDVLEFTEKRILLRNSSEDIFLDRESKDRASYRAACRRWHPDKFSQVYGRSIADPRESQQIMHKLTMIMQAVNESWKDRTTRSHIRKACVEEAARVYRGSAHRRSSSGS
ncbi:hypothetical protein FOZ60_015234 [Perkinsus olseni]|uniref:Uncharacterized protein n=1 Tax=Perkinsus olseni TaxID=32597 RepID=A0A7J6N5S5_PEROL|nr:hypothetical protein FOZ60_015234 [Perkinsus olseni]